LSLFFYFKLARREKTSNVTPAMMTTIVRISILTLLATSFTSCSTTARQARVKGSPLALATADLVHARQTSLPLATRAGLYVAAADTSSKLFVSHLEKPQAEKLYNSATGELTMLLRSSPSATLWNRPLQVSAHGKDYQLNFHGSSRDGFWPPMEFNSFVLSQSVPRKHIRRTIAVPGVGGSLVGIKKLSPLPSGDIAPFQPKRGFVSPVTATLDFNGSKATLGLIDPAVQSSVRLRGKVEPLAADFTAPIAFHPASRGLLDGLMGFIHADKYVDTTALYMLHPYDPKRIPVVLVHGLVSSPQIWANVINEVEGNPQLRGRFQFWVFRYATGNPVVFSAMRCREELAKAQTLYPMPNGFIMVGHSMGGLVSRLQSVDTGRALWDANFGTNGQALDTKLPPDHLVKRALLVQANPQVKRLVFICVPHRGSELATGRIGQFAMKLVTLPASILGAVEDTVGAALIFASGKRTLPNGITSLSPKNPTLIALDKISIRAPYHSIIGDRGKGNTPNSTDGVVPYWSSHLDNAQSELIVPGPHSSYELQQSINELNRILLVQLKAGKTPKP
jgi:pimeloyl-ACP methyl ester carboxylesterase